MSVDVTKHLERAKKYLEKNKLQEAAEEYQAVLAAFPNNQEAVQSLGDLYTRMGDPTRAGQYYGMLFDRYADTGDSTKAAALYSRFLKGIQQSPDRMMRFAHLLQRQNRRDEAIEMYSQAGEQFLAQRAESDALACWEKIATLDPDNAKRHIKLGEVAEKLGRTEIAARGFLRAGQLTLGSGNVDGALEHFARAHKLAPADRSVALMYADALLAKGSAREAVKLLEPLPPVEGDAAFQSVFGSALMKDGQLDRARGVLEQLYKDRPESFERMFELCEQFVRAEQDARAAEVLSIIKQRMFAAKRVTEFTAAMDRLADANPKSIPIAEFSGRTYDELNRESKYFTYLTRLFDLYLDAGNSQGATSAFDRIVDIDPYDQHNHARMDRLQGKVDPAYIRGVATRLGKSVQSVAPMNFRDGAEGSAQPTVVPGGGGSDEARAKQALEDLIVQAEIFLQYSLSAKAVERLQKIAEMFPGEEENNARLRTLYETANWWPPSAGKKKDVVTVEAKAAVVVPATSQTGAFSADTMRDLGKVSEITRAIHRQATPKAVLSVAVNEIGKYLRASRALAVIGPTGQPPQLAAEYATAGLEPSKPHHVTKLVAALAGAPPDSMGVITLKADASLDVGQMGLETVLAVPLTDRESQQAVGMLLAGSDASRHWKPNEGYFLQAVGDQVVIGVNHTKLRSLMRNLAVADEKTGLLGRSSYTDCLLSESNRMKSQNTPLSLVILSVDRGLEMLRTQGEPQLDRHMEQLARTLQSSVRSNDLAVKYTSWAVAFILPDTRLADAVTLADKLRKVSSGVQPPWNGGGITVSASVVEAVNRPDFDSEDIVTDLMNRAEFGLEEARKKGGDTIASI